MAQKDLTPDKDAGMGLIYRLNNLWVRADYFSEKGQQDKWDIILDIIFSNLNYRNEMVKVVDKKTGKISYKLAGNDFFIFKYFKLEIYTINDDISKTRNPKTKEELKSKLYYRLFEKGIWLRRMMQKQKLYLKESEQRQGSSTYGTFGRGKQ